MSYEISLYNPDFLQRAIQEGLGDWTDADHFADEISELAKSLLSELGYLQQDYPWNTDCVSYQHPKFKELIEVTVFKGCISFAIQYSSEATESIELAINAAKELGEKLGLAVYDPQDGKIIQDEA